MSIFFYTASKSMSQHMSALVGTKDRQIVIFDLGTFGQSIISVPMETWALYQSE